MHKARTPGPPCRLGAHRVTRLPPSASAFLGLPAPLRPRAPASPQVLASHPEVWGAGEDTDMAPLTPHVNTLLATQVGGVGWTKVL